MNRHPQHQQLAEAHDKAQADRFTGAEWAAAISGIKRSQEQRVEVCFMDIDLICYGTYTPNTDGYCDNGGFEISKALHKGEDIQDLLCHDYQVRLEEACFDEYERMLKEQDE